MPQEVGLELAKSVDEISRRYKPGAVFSDCSGVKPPEEVKFLTWTEDNLLRQVVYEGLRKGGTRVLSKIGYLGGAGQLLDLAGVAAAQGGAR